MIARCFHTMAAAATEATCSRDSTTCMSIFGWFTELTVRVFRSLQSRLETLFCTGTATSCIGSFGLDNDHQTDVKVAWVDAYGGE